MKKVISGFLAFILLALPITIFTLYGEGREFNFWTEDNVIPLGYLNTISNQNDWTFSEVAEEIAYIWSDESDDAEGLLNRYVFRTTRKISDTLAVVGGYASDLFEFFAIAFPWDFNTESTPFDWSEV